MFVVRKHDQPVKWPVKVSRPEDEGKVSRHGFTAHFLVKSQAELEEISGVGNQAFLAKIWVGWSEDLRGADNESLPFSEAARDELAGITYVAGAVISAYWEMMAGRAAKNS